MAADTGLREFFDEVSRRDVSLVTINRMHEASSGVARGRVQHAVD